MNQKKKKLIDIGFFGFSGLGRVVFSVGIG
jgi:hypothetical protein